MMDIDELIEWAEGHAGDDPEFPLTAAACTILGLLRTGAPCGYAEPFLAYESEDIPHNMREGGVGLEVFGVWMSLEDAQSYAVAMLREIDDFGSTVIEKTRVKELLA